MVKKNILLSYILAFSKTTWFWLGIWIFYYLRFTNYAGIGIIETILVLTVTLAEIPTGVVADLIGKKKTLTLAFLLETIGGLMMATAPNFNILALSVFVLGIGSAFYSGTIDALIFDSLKEEGKEDSYDKKISNINSISLISPAICGILGGFMYKVNPSLPFYANTFGYLIGFIASFFLKEPYVDTEKFSFANFFKQSGKGLQELFKTVDIKKQTILLLFIGFFVIIASEMIDGFLGFEFGFNEIQMGILWSIIYVVCAVASQLTPLIRKTLKGNSSIIVVGVLMGVTFIISPFIGLVVGGLSLAFRSSLHSIFGNLYSTLINNNTDSKFRATTLSTFNMIKNTPYVLTAFFIGSLSDKFSAKTIALYLGVILITFILIPLIPPKRKLITQS
jgi:MFS family permease